MDWLAGSRLHLLDIAVTRGLTYVPIYLLGFADGPQFVWPFRRTRPVGRSASAPGSRANERSE
jgi:hypothetical protein